METEVLKSLLKDYEEKRRQAEADLENRKEELYNKNPRLKEVEDDLNKYAITTAKSMLANGKGNLKELNKKVAELKKEKKAILKKENLAPDFLQPKYSCNKCKDTGYVVDQDYKTVMCNCLKQRLIDISYNKSNISNLSKENFSNFNLNAFSNKVDKQKYGQDISPRENMKDIKENCEKFIENFENIETKNLLFTGNTGLRENIYV